MIIQELSLVTLQHFLVENFPVMMPIITILNERLHLKTISLSDASPDNYAPEVSEGGIKALLEGYNTSSGGLLRVVYIVLSFTLLCIFVSDSSTTQSWSPLHVLRISLRLLARWRSQ